MSVKTYKCTHPRGECLEHNILLKTTHEMPCIATFTQCLTLTPSNLQRIKLVTYNVGRIFNPVSSQNFTKILCTVDNFPRFAIIKWVVLKWKLRLRGCNLVNLHLKWSPLSQQIHNISFLPLDSTFNSVNLHDCIKHKTSKTLELQPSNVHLL